MKAKAIAVAAATVVLAGCGSSATPTASTMPGAVTKANFIAAAETVCRRDHARLSVLSARADSAAKSTAANSTLPPILLQAVTLERADIARLRALPRPLADVHIIEAIVTAYEEEATDTTNLAHAVEVGEISNEQEALTTARDAKTRARSLEEGYGLRCGGTEK